MERPNIKNVCLHSMKHNSRFYLGEDYVINMLKFRILKIVAHGQFRIFRLIYSCCIFIHYYVLFFTPSM